jgi:integrase
VFSGETNAYGKAMDRACKLAGVPSFNPKSLRHRRLTLWHHQGVPVRVIADRAGHSKTSMTLDTYSHVLDPGEVPAERLIELVDDA